MYNVHDYPHTTIHIIIMSVKRRLQSRVSSQLGADVFTRICLHHHQLGMVFQQLQTVTTIGLQLLQLLQFGIRYTALSTVGC